MKEGNRLYIVLINVHGLIRGENLEIGRDADTNEQIDYVVELAKTLSRHPMVDRVDLLTRLISDSKVGPDYSVPIEDLGNGAYIVRLDCGPNRYLRKEVLWPYLYNFSDQALQHVKKVGRIPDIVHSHYADSAFVGTTVAGLLGVQHIYTGHSLGKVEKKRFLDQGIKEEVLDEQYNMSMRIESEEKALENSLFIIASTRHEAENQYALYENLQANRIVVIPPGTDVSMFNPPRRGWDSGLIKAKIDRFFMEPKKPMILSISGAKKDENINTLVQAYGENKELQKIANLTLIVGTRDFIPDLAPEPREILTEMLFLIDKYNLYGSIAYPKDIFQAELPDLYKLAKKTGGVFVNPSSSDSFGVSLLEAAASGLPVVAINDGGPRDIVSNCKNGLLIDPEDVEKMGQVILESVSNQSRWINWSRNGIKGVERHYSWNSHVEKYIKTIDKRTRKAPKKRMPAPEKSQLPMADRIIISEIDQTLIGDSEALRRLIPVLENRSSNIGFGIATGRGKDATISILKDWNIPTPDFIITSVGTEIYYGKTLVPDSEWEQHISYKWMPDKIRETMKEIKGIWMQPPDAQQQYKISYYLDPAEAPSPRQIRRILRKNSINVSLIYSYKKFLDIIPVRASKGKAVQFLSEKWGLPIKRILVVGSSGTDEDMLRGEAIGVVVGNHTQELNKLKGKHQIYFSKGHYAWGIMEALEHLDFMGKFQTPDIKPSDNEPLKAKEAKVEDEEMEEAGV